MKNRLILILTGAVILSAVALWMCRSVLFIIFMAVLGAMIGGDIGKNSCPPPLTGAGGCGRLGTRRDERNLGRNHEQGRQDQAAD
jgi:hypothetical protein